MPHAFGEIVIILVEVHFMSQSINPTPFFRRIGRIGACWVIMMLRPELLQRQSKLAHVAEALNPLRPAPDLRDGRQQQRRQNSDDGDDHQQLHQRERGNFILERRGHSQTIPDFDLCDNRQTLILEPLAPN